MVIQTRVQQRPVGELLKTWRQHRRLSQLDLAVDAEVSARHISFLETGRALPSRQMVLHLAEHLDVPLRERNTLLTAAGFAPVYSETPLDDPAMVVVREAIDLVLTGHEPYPALAVDRHWNLVASNRPARMLLDGVAPKLLVPPVNVLRLSLHPEGIAPRIENLSGWRSHALSRLLRQVESTADPILAGLYDELRSLPTPEESLGLAVPPPYGDLVVPLRIRLEQATLAFISTTTVFGTATDITLAEIAIESFFPADPLTADLLRQMAHRLIRQTPQESG